eukprot:gene28464-62384_t
MQAAVLRGFALGAPNAARSLPRSARPPPIQPNGFVPNRTIRLYIPSSTLADAASILNLPLSVLGCQSRIHVTNTTLLGLGVECSSNNSGDGPAHNKGGRAAAQRRYKLKQKAKAAARRYQATQEGKAVKKAAARRYHATQEGKAEQHVDAARAAGEEVDGDDADDYDASAPPSGRRKRSLIGTVAALVSGFCYAYCLAATKGARPTYFDTMTLSTRPEDRSGRRYYAALRDERVHHGECPSTTKHPPHNNATYCCANCNSKLQPPEE